MRKITLVLLVALSVTMISCGGGQKGVMTPQTTTISGELGDEFEIVDKSVKLNGEDSFSKIWTIELRSLTDEHVAQTVGDRVPVGTITADGLTHEHVGFGLETYDKDGNLVANRSAREGGLCGVYSSTDIEELMTLKKGETGTIRWSCKANEDEITGLTFKITSVKTNDNR